MAGPLSWLTNLARRRKRDALLAEAVAWPIYQARLLKSSLVAKDPLAEGGTSFQESQVEAAYYFNLPSGYFGGHLRSAAVSDSEGHRLLRNLPEDPPVNIRYDPASPDRTVALPQDNPDFPATIWPGSSCL